LNNQDDKFLFMTGFVFVVRRRSAARILDDGNEESADAGKNLGKIYRYGMKCMRAECFTRDFS